jgi:cytochrome c peroxidase
VTLKLESLNLGMLAEAVGFGGSRIRFGGPAGVALGPDARAKPRRPAKRVAPLREAAVLAVLFALAALVCPMGAWAGEGRGEPVLPIPRDPGQDPGKVALGARLFQDPRLSADNTLSCASCHRLAQGGADGRAQSVGVGGALGPINAPTVYNSGFNLAQFWDGRAASLEEQAAGPIHNPLEMASNWAQVLDKLRADPSYLAQFAALYPDGLTSSNAQDAIAAFERSLVTPDSPLDLWLAGDQTALSPQALRGYRLFKSYGCVACHQGVNLGGNLYQRMGALGDYFGDRGTEVRPADLGRFNVTGDPEDRHLFKVPGLRLAALTPPYFHDGSAATLEEAIRVMARYQLGRTVSQEDMADIAAFLRSAVGRHPLLTP